MLQLPAIYQSPENFDKIWFGAVTAKKVFFANLTKENADSYCAELEKVSRVYNESTTDLMQLAEKVGPEQKALLLQFRGNVANLAGVIQTIIQLTLDHFPSSTTKLTEQPYIGPQGLWLQHHFKAAAQTLEELLKKPLEAKP